MSQNVSDEVWYALRTFFSAERKVEKYLASYKQPCFIPSFRSRKVVSEDKSVIVERPVVHNLLFLRKVFSDRVLKEILANCPYPVNMYRDPQRHEKWACISGKEMLELRMICDSTFCEPTFLTPAEADLQPGRMVRVMHGPMKGMIGKMVRKNKKYYVIKSFTGIAVEITVSRWCCEPYEEKN